MSLTSLAPALITDSRIARRSTSVAWHGTHKHARTRSNETVFMHFLDEMLQHFLSDLEVGDDPIFKRADRSDIARSSTQHAFCIYADCRYRFLVVMLPNCHHRGLIKDDASLPNINQCIGRSEID